MKRVERQSFTVVGSYRFPLDMLRYDSCWPKNPHAVSALEDALRSVRTNGIVEVELASDSTRAPTVGRWESFGWHVRDVEESR